MKIQNKKLKTATTIISVLVIGIMLSSPTTVMPKVNAQPQPVDIAPPSPVESGCYHYTKGAAGWVSVPCLPDSEIQAQIKAGKLYPPTQGGSTGVYGESTFGTLPTTGEDIISFTAFGGEYDSLKGTGAWSIQTNTNYFAGNNGQTDSVQFAEQEWPNNNNYERNCVWQNDITTQTYNPTCILVPQQTLSSSYAGYVKGQIVSGALESTYCNLNTGNCWSVVVSDKYGITANKWTDVSGTILGYGGGSTANFNHITSEQTSIYASPETSAFQINPDVTNEMNNLNYNSHSTSCSSGGCTTTSNSSV